MSVLFVYVYAIMFRRATDNHKRRLFGRSMA